MTSSDPARFSQIYSLTASGQGGIERECNALQSFANLLSPALLWNPKPSPDSSDLDVIGLLMGHDHLTRTSQAQETGFWGTMTFWRGPAPTEVFDSASNLECKYGWSRGMKIPQWRGTRAHSTRDLRCSSAFGEHRRRGASDPDHTHPHQACRRHHVRHALGPRRVAILPCHAHLHWKPHQTQAGGPECQCSGEQKFNLTEEGTEAGAVILADASSTAP